MSIILDTKKFLQVLIPSIPIIASIFVKRYKELSIFLYVLGWFWLTFNLNTEFRLSIRLLASIGVLISILLMYYFEDIESNWIYLLYAVSLLITTYSIEKFNLGLISALLIITGTVYFIPKQKKECQVEGPGIALIILGTIGLAFVNAM